MQGQHHEKIAEILMQEKDKLQEDCHRLKLEMQSHTEEVGRHPMGSDWNMRHCTLFNLWFSWQPRRQSC